MHLPCASTLTERRYRTPHIPHLPRVIPGGRVRGLPLGWRMMLGIGGLGRLARLPLVGQRIVLKHAGFPDSLTTGEPPVPPSGGGAALPYFGIGPVYFGIGPARLGIGPARFGIGPARLGVGPARLGVGPARLGVGPAYFGAGPARLGVGPAHFGSGPAHFGIGPLYFGIGPARLGVGPARGRRNGIIPAPPGGSQGSPFQQNFPVDLGAGCPHPAGAVTINPQTTP